MPVPDQTLTFVEDIKSTLQAYTIDVSVSFNQVTIVVLKSDIADILMLLKSHESLLMKQLVDVCGVDYPHHDQRFEVVYHLLSLRKNQRVRLKVRLDENEEIDSVHHIFSCANWYEREIWDLFGIKFTGHPDLRRILTDYEFEGHPLRKDFPLTGYTEMRYDDALQKVVYNPVQLPQAFRDFDTLSPWHGPGLEPTYDPNGLTSVLPGDEKATQGPLS